MIFGLIVVEGPSVESASPSYKGHRYPVEVISHPLSQRDSTVGGADRAGAVSATALAALRRTGHLHPPAAAPATA